MRHRGRAQRRDPAWVAVAAEVSIRDFAALHGISVSLVRGLVAQGLPVYRYPGKLTVPRAEGAAWLTRFRSDRVGRLVDSVLQDMRS